MFTNYIITLRGRALGNHSTLSPKATIIVSSLSQINFMGNDAHTDSNQGYVESQKGDPSRQGQHQCHQRLETCVSCSVVFKEPKVVDLIKYKMI